MTQLDMFADVVKNGKREIEVSPEVLEAREVKMAIDYADEYIEKKEFAQKINGKWFYKKDEYKLLHYLLQFALGNKKSIAGWELASVLFNNRHNTEKLRGMVRALRNNVEIDLVIGSSSKGYFIAKKNETFDAVKYIYAKSLDEMMTAIKMYPPLFERYIKVAQKVYQETDKSHDSQITAQFDELTEELINDMVIRYADTLKQEAKKLNKKNDENK